MGTYNETYEIEQAIRNNLETVMRGQIAEDAKTAITQATLSEVYMAYDSKLPPTVKRDNKDVRTRRWHEGGLADPQTYEANYHPDTLELIVTVKTEWHNIGFKVTTGTGTGGNDFADVIENNGMYGAPKRPFIKQAEDNIKTIKVELEKTIADYLNRTV